MRIRQIPSWASFYHPEALEPDRTKSRLVWRAVKFSIRAKWERQETSTCTYASLNTGCRLPSRQTMSNRNQAKICTHSLRNKKDFFWRSNYKYQQLLLEVVNLHDQKLRGSFRCLLMNWQEFKALFSGLLPIKTFEDFRSAEADLEFA